MLDVQHRQAVDRAGCVVRLPATSIRVLATIRSMSSRSSRQASRRSACPSSSGQRQHQHGVGAGLARPRRRLVERAAAPAASGTLPVRPAAGRRRPPPGRGTAPGAAAGSSPSTAQLVADHHDPAHAGAARSRARCSRCRSTNREHQADRRWPAAAPPRLAAGDRRSPRRRPRRRSRRSAPRPARSTRWYSSVPTNRYRPRRRGSRRASR